MNIKRKSLFFSLVGMLFIFLIGFIGWGFSSSSFERSYKKVKANKSCVDVKELRLSEYCKDGFVEDYTITNIGILYVDLSLDIKTIYEEYNLFINNDSLDLNVKLEYDVLFNELDLIKYCFVNTECNYCFNNELIKCNTFDELNNSKNKINTIIKFNNLNNKDILNINLMYLFDVSCLINETSFEKEVYDKLVDKGITFKVIAKL